MDVGWLLSESRRAPREKADPPSPSSALVVVLDSILDFGIDRERKQEKRQMTAVVIYVCCAR